jgi:hypothetical protein
MRDGRRRCDQRKLERSAAVQIQEQRSRKPAPYATLIEWPALCTNECSDCRKTLRTPLLTLPDREFECNSTSLSTKERRAPPRTLRSSLAGRRMPSGSGDALPPSVVTKATLPGSPGNLPHAALDGPIKSSLKGSPATMKRPPFLAGRDAARMRLTGVDGRNRSAKDSRLSWQLLRETSPPVARCRDPSITWRVLL